MSEDEFNWYWGEGPEPECYSVAESKEAAVDAATEHGQAFGYHKMTIVEAKPETLSDNFFDAGAVIDQWHDHNEEHMNEDGELQMEPNDAQLAELERMLNNTFTIWRTNHKLGRAWNLNIRYTEILDLEP